MPAQPNSGNPVTSRSTSTSLARIATGRATSLFAPDMDNARDRIADAVTGRRILAIGAAGSIGSSTLDVMVGFAPAAVHIVDQSENSLAELMRRFRSGPEEVRVADLRALPLDYGSPAMRYFIESEAPYDLVLNFAALKHVRTEKDPFSTLQMVDTNIMKQARLLRWLAQRQLAKRYFSVSTDKAANPSSLMGATKRAMEHVMFDREVSGEMDAPVTSARFANVAFSNGSLLQSFGNRLERGEPIACPSEIRRYFVSLEESGEICTLAATLLDDRNIAIPRLNPEDHLVPLEMIASEFIAHHGFTPRIYEDESAARGSVASDRAQGFWPLLLTPPDTAGEKLYEEFVAAGEEVREVGLAALQAVPYRATGKPVRAMLAELENIMSIEGGVSNALTKQRLMEVIAMVEPEFLHTHQDSALNLDQRA
jgi:nucleoside-diphosphate-sugar epimerase